MRCYRAHAWTHPIQAAVVAAPLSLAIVTLSVMAPLALAVAAEAVLLFVLPHVPAFRRHAQRAWEEEARAAAVAEREASIATMNKHDRAELERLDALVSDIDERTGRGSGIHHDWHGLHATLATYLRLATSRRAIDEAFTTTMGEQITHELEAVRGAEATPESRAVLALHRRLLSDRLALWCAMRSRADVIARELATLAEVVRYAHDACVAASVTTAAGGFSSSVRGVAHNIGVLREVAALRADAAS